MDVLQVSWRGRDFNVRSNMDGKKHVTMIGSNSLIYIPISALENAVYRITVEMYRESGNGIVYCNIYGNRSYDFSHAKIECGSNSWNTYTVDLKTGNFPKTIPLIFRIWRKPDGTGKLLVRNVKIELLSGETKEDVEPKLIGKKPTRHPTRNGNDEKNFKKPRRAIRTPRQRRRAGKPPQAPAKKEENKHDGVRQFERQGGRNKRGKGPVGEKIVIPTPEPKILPIVIGDDGVKVSVVISVFNRRSFFNRTLYTYAKQTMSKKEFEIVVIDTQSTEDIRGLCKQHAEKHGIQFQYILIDENKGDIEQCGWTPALSNNIGFKHARGSVIVITGPESLQKESNLELSWNSANEGKCIYGNIYRSSREFVNRLVTKNQETLSFREMAEIEGARHDESVTKGWWWYYVAVRKEHIMNIKGVDERFMRGMAGEDDNFALRMVFSGVPLARNEKIIGIHQDHSVEDKSDVHAVRFNKSKWKRLRNHNQKLAMEWSRIKEPIANTNIEWGAERAVILKEVF